MKDRSHDEVMSERLRADPDYATELLMNVERDDDSAELAIFMRQLDQAFGKNRLVGPMLSED